MSGRDRWRPWRRVVQREPVTELDDELAFHLEQRIRDYVDRGMDQESARKAAFERLGDVERVRYQCACLLAAERRSEERRTLLNISWLDVKLGVRMLAKYPGLSLVSVIGMAVAIAIGAGVFAVISAIVDPTLPLPGGDRIVAVLSQRADRPGDPETRVLHDFVAWRSELTTVRDLGAFRLTRRNLMVEGRGTELVDIAEMSAAGFHAAQIPPLLGRPLLADDERPGAPPVLVIGHEAWQRRFDGDPNVVGRTVRLGETVHTVVGVMPEAFRFPLNHGYWAPLQLDVSDYARGAGPRIQVFGRLADGVTIEQARAQVAAIARRMAAAYPEANGHLRPTIVPYAHALFEIDYPGMAWALYLVQVGTSLLLVLVAANVGVLVYARTAARTGEIAVRTALGASRGRVIAQLFVEALVLSTGAAAFGLTLAVVALGWIERLMVSIVTSLPFWFDLGLSGGLIAYGAVLAILGGTIVGVLPALKATGRKANGGLQQLAARGAGMQLGGTWTVLIVVQVGIAVAVLPSAIYIASELVRYGTRDLGYPAEEFFHARLSLWREEAPPSAETDAYQRAFGARFADRADELMRRFEAERDVGASYVSDFPGGEPDRWFELEDGAATVDPTDPATRGATVRAAVSSVGAGFFDLYDAPILAGRDFVDADAAEGSSAVIVDRAFAERMGGGNVVGRWIRDPRRDGSRPGDAERAPWLEIVGVVADLPSPTGWDDVALPNVYSAATAGGIRALGGVQATSIEIIVRAGGGPTPAFTRRLRDIVASVEPGFQLHELRNVAEAERVNRRTSTTIAVGVAVVTLSVLLLSAAGIYAMLSFTVARRRREIGIRTALGADRRRILGGIFARAGAQLGAGVAVGLMLALALQWATGGSAMGNRSGVGDGLQGALVLMPIVAAIVMAVGLLAALGPARRGLSVQPTEALREE